MPPLFHPRRELGRTGFTATQLGIGDVADRRLPIDQCVSLLHRALDAGLNLLDTAPNYEDGYSEQIVGQALQSRKRDSLFLISKIDHFDQPAPAQIEGSLSRLKTDYVDAFVLHALSTPDAWQAATSPGGLFDQLDAARKAGKLRFRGISSHDPDTLRLAVDSGLCDLLMFPVGPYVHERYLTEILPLCKAKRIATVCFKTFGAGKLLADTSGYNQPLESRPRGKMSSGGSDDRPTPANSTLPRLTVEECLHFTLTHDPDVTLLGMSFPNEQDAAFAAAQSFRQPLAPPRLADLQRRANEAIRDKGRIWWNPNGV